MTSNRLRVSDIWSGDIGSGVVDRRNKRFGGELIGGELLTQTRQIKTLLHLNADHGNPLDLANEIGVENTRTDCGEGAWAFYNTDALDGCGSGCPTRVDMPK